MGLSKKNRLLRQPVEFKISRYPQRLILNIAEIRGRRRAITKGISGVDLKVFFARIILRCSKKIKR